MSASETAVVDETEPAFMGSSSALVHQWDHGYGASAINARCAEVARYCQWPVMYTSHTIQVKNLHCPIRRLLG